MLFPPYEPTATNRPLPWATARYVSPSLPTWISFQAAPSSDAMRRP